MTVTKIKKDSAGDDKAQSLVLRFADKWGVDPQKLYSSLTSVAFKQRDGSAPTVEQMIALLIVAEQYGLNPFTGEIYAFQDKGEGIIPVIGVNGWLRIINDHPQYDGVTFRYAETMATPIGGKPCPEWIECTIYRKDRSHPTVVVEFLDEVYRESKYKMPWQTHTKRQLRHKGLIQAARVAFGFVGVYDQDEAERILEAGSVYENAPALKPAPAPAALGHEEVEKINFLTDKVILRAQADGSWSAAAEYLSERFSDNDAARQHAMRRLMESNPETNNVDSEQPELILQVEPD